MERRRIITELACLYYEVVNWDHHKDRDCHFTIALIWSYGDGPTFVVRHQGYLHEIPSDNAFSTMEEAEDHLIERIGTFITEECQSCIANNDETERARATMKRLMDIYDRAQNGTDTQT